MNSAVYLINRTPSSVHNFRRPLDVLSDHHVLPPIVHLPPHVFGCVMYVHLHPHQRSKLDKRAIKYVFVGYGSTQKGYRAYHPTSKRFFISMDVMFHEDNFFYVDSTLQGGNESEVQEALTDPKWTAAMVEEMTTLGKKQHLGSCNFTKREENSGVQMDFYN